MDASPIGDDDLLRAVQSALGRAKSFLEAGQVANGRWLDFRSERLVSSFWVTAYVGASLARATGSPSALAKARAYLLANEHPRGGWGYSIANPPDGDTIANALHFVVETRGEAPNDPAIERVTQYLLRYWEEREGGFRTYYPIAGDPLREEGSSWCDAHLCVTGMAGQALYLADKERHRDRLEACADLLRARQSPSGCWEAFWWDGRTYSTYHAARLVSLMGDSGHVGRACDWLLTIRDESGGWGNGTGGEVAPFHTALAVSTLLLNDEHGRGGAARAGIEWLMRNQDADGGFRSLNILRVPPPEVHAPWERPQTTSLIADRNRLFTTATVVSALVQYLDVRERSG